MSDKERFTITYNEESKMMQYVDNNREEPNRWAVANAIETAQYLNSLNRKNVLMRDILEKLLTLTNIKVSNEDIIYRTCFDIDAKHYRMIQEILK